MHRAGTPTRSAGAATRRQGTCPGAPAAGGRRVDHRELLRHGAQLRSIVGLWQRQKGRQQGGGNGSGGAQRAVQRGVGAGVSARACLRVGLGRGREGRADECSRVGGVQGHSRRGGGCRGSCCETAHQAWRGPQEARTAASGARRGAPPHPQALEASTGRQGEGAKKMPPSRAGLTWLEKEGSSWGGYVASTLARAEEAPSRDGRPAVSKLMRAAAGAGGGEHSRGQRVAADGKRAASSGGALPRRGGVPQLPRRRGRSVRWCRRWLPAQLELAERGGAQKGGEKAKGRRRDAAGGPRLRRAAKGGGYAGCLGGSGGQTLTNSIQPVERGAHT